MAVMTCRALPPLLVLLVALFSPTQTFAQDAPDAIASALRAAVPADATDYVIDAAGLTRSGRPIVSLEPTAPPSGLVRKVVIVGGLDGRAASASAVTAFVQSWFSDGGQRYRGAWQIAAVPCALPDSCLAPAAPLVSVAFPPDKGYFNAPDQPESRFLWRWIAMQAPDLVINVSAGPAPSSLAVALRSAGLVGDASVTVVDVPIGRGASVLGIESVMENARRVEISPLRRLVDARTARTPLEVARLMAGRYPANPIMSYIPALAWSGALRLSKMTGDAAFADRARAQMTPFLSGEKPAIAEPHLLTSLAGHQAFADLAAMAGDPAGEALARKAADFILSDTPGEIVRFRTKWTDDMFMATSVLARVAQRSGDARYAEAVSSLLTTYAESLQRPDGLFIHALAGPFPWGRGNGFAAFGLVEALTHLPADWPARARVLEIYRRHMKAMADHQAPDGMWRQVVDEPGSYRELTVTAMTVAAMARGIRLGWLDGSFRPIVDRAWHGLLARVADDGTLLDVCTGTGSGPTKQYYLDRAAVAGADDRGGAMTLTAALEMAELVAAR